MKITVVIVAFCFFLIPSIAHACSCPIGKPPSEFNRAKAIFIGRMLGGTEKLPVKVEKGKAYKIEAGSVRFAVEELFKGNISNQITITIDSNKGTSCGDYGLKRGERYLVYAYSSESDEDQLYDSSCTRTALLNSKEVKEDLDFLRNLPPPGTGGSLRGSFWVDTKALDEGDSEPLSNLKVFIRAEDGQIIEVTTNKEGEFEVKKIKAGRYRVEPQIPENYYVKESYEDVEIADRGTAEVLFTAYFRGKVMGRFVDKNGVGFNSVYLNLLSVNENNNQRHIKGFSDGENGNFSIKDVPPGEYVLYLNLRHEDYKKHQNYYYPGTFKREDATVIKVGTGGTVDGLYFVLPDEFQIRTIEGQVFSKDGKPASNVGVTLLCPQISRPDGFTIGINSMSTQSTQTDKDGKFKLEGFAGEVYQLRASVIKGDSIIYAPLKKIALEENLKEIKVVLSESGYPSGCPEK